MPCPVKAEQKVAAVSIDGFKIPEPPAQLEESGNGAAGELCEEGSSSGKGKERGGRGRGKNKGGQRNPRR